MQLAGGKYSDTVTALPNPSTISPFLEAKILPPYLKKKECWLLVLFQSQSSARRHWELKITVDEVGVPLSIPAQVIKVLLLPSCPEHGTPHQELS
jgi:hypothetical protein